MMMSTTTKKDPVNQAKDSMAQATDKARETASQVGEAAQHATEAVGQKAEEATAYVGKSVQTAADSVRKHGPTEGVLGSASQTVADTLESTGKYIEDKNLSGMVDDVSGIIKRNPIPAVLIGVGIGFLIGRAQRSW